MHGRELNKEQDPTGWLMSEKLDGIRAFWDGSKFFSKPGMRLIKKRKVVGIVLFIILAVIFF